MDDDGIGSSRFPRRLPFQRSLRGTVSRLVYETVYVASEVALRDDNNLATLILAMVSPTV